jgi:hypothetical protein
MSLQHLLLLAVLAFTAPLFSAALTPAEQKIVDAVNAQVGTFSHDLEQVVQINSPSENLVGVRQVADHFGAQLTALGLEYRFAALPASSGRAGHLVAEHRGTQGKRLLLIGHLDTVLPGGKFRREGDALIGLRVLGAGEELLLVSEKGVIVRTQADAVPQQSRAATGVRLQKLDARDRLSEVVLVPPAAEEEEVPVDEDAPPLEVVALDEAVALTTEDAGASPAELESPASEG